MKRFIESIRIVNTKPVNISLHNERVSKTALHHYGTDLNLPIDKILKENDISVNTLYKLRIVYSNKLESYSIEPYLQKELRVLRAVTNDNIEYCFKYEDRAALDALYSKRGDCDDVLIIRRGIVTDTSYGNVLYSDGEKLYTPANPLLKGTKREQLLRDGKIIERDLPADRIRDFLQWYVINSMLDPIPVMVCI